MFVKVCGLKNTEQIDWAAELGYTAIGVVLHPESPRYCSAARARELASYSGGRLITVAVAVRYRDLKDVEDIFDYIQIYEPVKSEKLIFAGEYIPDGLECRYFLYDTSRGSGEFEEIPPGIGKIREKLIFAGGLNAENVRSIIKKIRPFGIDVSSGVEIKRGIKDYNMMKNFIGEVKNAAP